MRRYPTVIIRKLPGSADDDWKHRREWTLVFGVPEDPEVWKEQQRQMMGPAAEKYLELLQVEKKKTLCARFRKAIPGW